MELNCSGSLCMTDAVVEEGFSSFLFSNSDGKSRHPASYKKPYTIDRRVQDSVKLSEIENGNDSFCIRSKFPSEKKLDKRCLEGCAIFDFFALLFFVLLIFWLYVYVTDTDVWKPCVEDYCYLAPEVIVLICFVCFELSYYACAAFAGEMLDMQCRRDDIRPAIF